MRIVLDSLRECPILSHAARKAGIHRKTLENWMRCSAAGCDGYDIKWHGLTWRFHEHCKSAIDEPYQIMLDNLRQIAMGITYKTDENGNIIEEVRGKPNTKLMLRYLELMRPETYGKRCRSRRRRNRKNGIPQEGGVRVVGNVTKRPQYNTVASVKARTWKAVSRMVREAKAQLPLKS
jgi:hypothetical protein